MRRKKSISILFLNLFTCKKVKMAYKLNASKMLDELLKATSNCFDCFSKSEVWSDLEVNEVKNDWRRLVRRRI